MRAAKTLRCDCPCGFTVEGDPEAAAALFKEHRADCPSLPAYMRKPSRPSALKSTDKIRRSWPVHWPTDDE